MQIYMYVVSTTEVSSPSDILGGDGVSEDVPDTGVAKVTEENW